ncbi:MAG: succinate dehydrogenase, cytochrome b556 subunit [Thiotrichales bacterium]|nr:MAG: succinate dehydrogenase, cytochrome b556 subunit [Thiotrichales bacterium]
MQNNRPRNINVTDLARYKFPAAAICSILHRISGVFILVFTPLVIWILDIALRSNASFVELQGCLTSNYGKVFIWLCLSAFGYHFVAGLRHIFMDIGFGETLRLGNWSARIVILLAVLLSIFVGVWLW